MQNFSFRPSQYKSQKSSNRILGNERTEPFFHPPLQSSLNRYQHNDPNNYRDEQEAGAMADKVKRKPDLSAESNLFFKPGQFTIQRECAQCEEEENQALRKELNNNIPEASAQTENSINTLSGGSALQEKERNYFEPRMGYDFGSVKVHTDAAGAKSAQSFNARAYTFGNEIVFGDNEYRPESKAGKKLIAHELTHVVQQNSKIGRKMIQKADLTSPRLKGNTLFEDVLDNKKVIETGAKGPEVRRIQQLLIDLGFILTTEFANGEFGADTKSAVEKYQNKKKIAVDGRVGF